MSLYNIKADGIKYGVGERYSVSFTLNSNQVLTLAGGILIIPAAKANQGILIENGMLRMNVAGLPYVSAGATILYCTSLGVAPNNAQAQISLAGFLTSTVTRTVRLQGPATAIGTVINQVVAGDSISIGATAAVTVGLGTIDGWINYTVYDM